mmetsp:Transcript_7943/g.14392  ORF Transcript_7943/g.14392 Transcript_7943/m.14392 type:complete len:83 (+) Transcript_7943:550-798(+)
MISQIVQIPRILDVPRIKRRVHTEFSVNHSCMHPKLPQTRAYLYQYRNIQSDLKVIQRMRSKLSRLQPESLSTTAASEHGIL